MGQAEEFLTKMKKKNLASNEIVDPSLASNEVVDPSLDKMKDKEGSADVIGLEGVDTDSGFEDWEGVGDWAG